MANYRQEAMEALGYSPVDLRDPAKLESIDAKAAELQAERKTRSGSRVTQAQVAQVLDSFKSFRKPTKKDPYGPTVIQVHERLVGEGATELKRSSVAQHLSKMRKAGAIGSAPTMKVEGMKGRPPVQFFLLDAEYFDAILAGDETAS